MDSAGVMHAWTPSGHKPTEPQPGFGWVRIPDARAHRYPMASALTEPIGARRRPRSKTWRTFVPALDQGSSSECTFFTATGLLMSRPTRRSKNPFTREKMREGYLLAQDRDPWPGREPTYYGTNEDAVMSVLRDWGYIREWRHCFTMDEVIETASFEGVLAFGSNWYDSMSRPDPDGRLRITPTARIVGGHEYMLGVSINNSRGVVWIQNSWSEDWGLRGRAYMDLETVERLLIDEDGDMIFPIEQIR